MTIMNDPNDADENIGTATDDDGKRGGTSEAGVFRGLARSVGRNSGSTAHQGISMLRIPTIGRLPATSATTTTTAASASKVVLRQPKILPSRPSDFIPRKVPVKQVVKVSDHVSQGINVIDSASESSTISNKKTKNSFENRAMQFRTFASSLVKNTILGIVVFEAYGSIVDYFIPKPSSCNAVDEKMQTLNAAPAGRPGLLRALPYINSFETVVGIHTLGGFIGGSAHGVVATLWDSVAVALRTTPHRWGAATLRDSLNPAVGLMRQQLHGMILHHAFSHAVLFGSYELSKRLILTYWTPGVKRTPNSLSNDKNADFVKSTNQEPMIHVEYLAYVFLAGGIAGQSQHTVSHFTENFFLRRSNSGFLPWRALVLPFLVSFFPSGIAFVALEYGHNG